MVKKTLEKYYSDLSEKEIDDYSPLSFAFDGNSYEIDLTDQEKAEFEKAMQKYVAAARSVATRSAAAKKRSNGSGHDPKVVRAWAVGNDIDVPARGRIPASVLAAYAASRK